MSLYRALDHQRVYGALVESYIGAIIQPHAVSQCRLPTYLKPNYLICLSIMATPQWALRSL